MDSGGSNGIGKHSGMQDLSMLGAGEGFPHGDQDSLKEDLKGWREVLIILDKFLKWDRPFYPAISVASTSIIFLLIWYLDLSVLTSFSMFMIVVGIVDFLVPFCGPSLTGYKSWSESEEEKFSHICDDISAIADNVLRSYNRLYDMREHNPRLFLAVSMTFLSLTAWIGYKFNNMLLVYLIVTFLLLLPGLVHHGIMNRVLNPLAGIMDKIKSGNNKSKLN